MSEKSTVTNQVISLPKGGGALSGLGEKFSPDLFTGTGNFTVPIALPPGRNGFQPQLNLGYSTGQGNGPFGLGWSVSVPGVTRKSSKGLPIYDNAKDVFVLSGAEDLVPVDGAPQNAQRYRPRTEGLFARIDHYHYLDQQKRRVDYWRVASKDGLVSYYGPAPETANQPDAAGSTVRDPDHPDHIFAWKLTLTVDTFGNRIEYGYTVDAGDTGEHRWQVPYLSQIRYIDYGDREQPKFLVAVDFRYQERPDPISEYRSGFEIRTTRRCRAIRTRSDGQRVRTVHLVYLDSPAAPPEPLPHNGASLLRQVRVQGHDDHGAIVGDDDLAGELTPAVPAPTADSEWLPPLQFGHTPFQPEAKKFIVVSGDEMPPASLAHPDYDLVDLFGCGLPDIVQLTTTGARYWRNLGDGRFDRPRSMRDAPAGFALGDPIVQLLDADGDGRMDLLVSGSTESGYFPLDFHGGWDRRSFHRYEVSPSFNLKDPEVRLLDLTGDGVTDVLRSGARFECFFNDPHKGWTGTRRIERRGFDEFPDVSFSDPRVKLADRVGDGLQDIILVHDGRIDYWPNLGYGRFGRRVTIHNAPRFPWGYDPKRILVGDVDGDGCADVVYVTDRKVTLWINQGGNRFGDPIEIEGTPRAVDLDSIRLCDLLGTGVAGVLWSTDTSSVGEPKMYFLDFTGGMKPYVLSQMDNHLGALTRVGYSPSTHHFLEDRKHALTWRASLPFPVQVVSRVEVIDQISLGKLTTEYSYHHGYWDGGEREFRGFGRVDQRDTEVFDRYHREALQGEREFAEVAHEHFSPPTEARTWFHLGPVGPEFGDWQELDLSSEYWSEDPPALARPAQVTGFLRGLPRRARRDAVRTLRGSSLRSEVYALDGSAHQSRPYSVTESIMGVREEEPLSKGDTPTRIFLAYSIAQRTTQWERGDEPRTLLNVTGYRDDDGVFDRYGRVRSAVTVAVPRGRDFRRQASEGASPYLTKLTLTEPAERTVGPVFIADRTARVTTYEILDPGTEGPDALTFALGIGPRSPRRLMAQSISYYDGPAFVGLPPTQIGDFGALVRTEELVLTKDLLAAAYSLDGSAEAPPYLGGSGGDDEYPPVFSAQLPKNLGFLYQAIDKDNEGYFSAITQRRYDTHADLSTARGLILEERDALGHPTLVEHDLYELLPIKVTDAAGLVTSAVHDYRLEETVLASDANDNRTAFSFTPLGLLSSIAVLGKAGQVGDTIDTPATRLFYDLHAFANRNQPVSVRTLQRLYHAGDDDADIQAEHRNDTLERWEYSDGSGRLLQTRSRAADILFVGEEGVGLPTDQDHAHHAHGELRPPNGLPNVVVSGWQKYDNKGRVVEQYEPFFDLGWTFTPSTISTLGQRVTQYYDPTGRVRRVVHPDGSEECNVYGIPESLSTPDVFRPSPWEVYKYDLNDNAGRVRPSGADAAHWDTPTSVEVDALGRTIRQVERTRNQARDPVEELVTLSQYDLRGNLVELRDSFGRVALRAVHDLAPGARTWRTQYLDSGVRRAIVDAAGNLIEQRDAKGALILRTYDSMNRPTGTWARDTMGEAPSLRERFTYDGADLVDAKVRNLAGRLHRHYDEAGLIVFESYDFKGNVASKVRRVISDEAIVASLGFRKDDAPATFRVSWDPVDEGVLGSDEYRTQARFDALSHVKRVVFPDTLTGSPRIARMAYDRAGAILGIDVETPDGNETIISYVAYDARGNRVLAAYGNGVMTRWAYDAKTFRMRRLRSEGFNSISDADGSLRFESTGTVYQDLGYEHDLIGNIVAINVRSPGSGIKGQDPDRLERRFRYDPLYRLLSATGRETRQSPVMPWDSGPRSQAFDETIAYRLEYQYDSVGNLARIAHLGATPWTRAIQLEPGDGIPKSNLLESVSMGQTVLRYSYDAAGNTVDEGSTRHFAWDHADRLVGFADQAENAEPTVEAVYLYDPAGHRTKKLVREKGGTLRVTVYIDDVFEHRFEGRLGALESCNVLQILEGSHRTAEIRYGAKLGNETPESTFALSDHLGSSEVVLGRDRAFVRREEFAPYGETTLGGYARKRYRFTGHERDEESGLGCHGKRFYAAWLGRWLSCDPDGATIGGDVVGYARGNPLSWTDHSGGEDRHFAKVDPRFEFNVALSVNRLMNNRTLANGTYGFTLSTNTGGKFNTKYWQAVRDDSLAPMGVTKALRLKQEVEHNTPAEALLRLVPQRGVSPADAGGPWTFDCGQFVQIVILDAFRQTLDDKAPGTFNRTLASGEFRLRPQLSTGLTSIVKYIYDPVSGGAQRFNENVAATTKPDKRINMEKLAEEAPKGTRVSFINLKYQAQTEKNQAFSFRNENTVKVGDDYFAAYGLGNEAGAPLMVLHSADIKLLLAVKGLLKEGVAKPTEEQIEKYTKDNIRVGEIEQYRFGPPK
jgi:RHS repeat-associated protein